MQAAVVSVLLMAGACGNSGEPLPAPGPTMQAVVQPGQMPAGNYASQYPSPNGGIFYRVGLLGCPQYTPVWLLKDCAAYYPGNYARPYDYREAFNYPWHGPRPLAVAPMIEAETAAKPAAKSRSASGVRTASKSSLTAK